MSIDRSEKARDELASVFCRITTGFFLSSCWSLKIREADAIAARSLFFPFYPRSSRMHGQVGTWKEHNKKKAGILISSFVSLNLKKKEEKERKNIPPFGGCRSIDQKRQGMN
jgi:hypothetical protein